MTVLATNAYVQFGTGGVADVHSTVRLTGFSHIHCCAYPDSAPILTVEDAHVDLSVTVPDPARVTAEDVARGRELAKAVGRYVAELERRAAASDDKAADPGGAGRAA
jgi:hypothetical protein